MAELLALADDETRAMWDGLTLGYTESTGHPLLRREIAALYDGIEPDDVLVFAGAEEAIFCLANVAARARRPRHRDLARLPEPVRGRARDRCGRDPPRAARGRRLGHRPRRAAAPRSRRRPGSSSSTPRTTRPGCCPTARRSTPSSPSPRRPAPTSSSTRSIAASSSTRPIACRPGRRRATAACPSGSCPSRSRWPACASAGWRRATATCWPAARAFKDYTTICSSAPSEVLALIGLRARDAVLARSRDIVARQPRSSRCVLRRVGGPVQLGPPAGRLGRVPAADRAGRLDRRLGGRPGRARGRPAPARVAVRLRRQPLPARVRADGPARGPGPAGGVRGADAPLIARRRPTRDPPATAPDRPRPVPSGPPSRGPCVGAPVRRRHRSCPTRPAARTTFSLGGSLGPTYGSVAVGGWMPTSDDAGDWTDERGTTGVDARKRTTRMDRTIAGLAIALVVLTLPAGRSRSIPPSPSPRPRPPSTSRRSTAVDRPAARSP